MGHSSLSVARFLLDRADRENRPPTPMISHNTGLHVYNEKG